MARPKPLGDALTPDDIEAAFYTALRARDLDALMALWSDDEEIFCVHPAGPRVIGAGAIRHAFELVFSSGAISVHPERVRRLQRHDCAIHSVLEHIEVDTGGEAGKQSGWLIATNVYVLTPQGWRMASHHASPGAATSEVLEVSESGAVLH